jgi:hypothetical protein
MKSNFLFVLLSFSFFFSSLVYGQSLMYSTSISSTQGQNYSVDITLELTGIVVAQNSCQYGYNYDVDYNYTIQFNGNSPGSLNTLQGTLDCGSNQGIFFNLPLTQGSG